MLFLFAGIYCNRTTRISTTTDYGLMYLDEYGISTSGSTYITFQVQACSDAHIALKYQKKKQPIEIVIGGWRNTRSCIRLTPQDNCSVTTMGAMLDCAEYRQFTLYWTESQIFVKQGNRTAEKSNIFLHLPLNFTISDIKVGISTGYGFSGKWMLEGNLSRSQVRFRFTLTAQVSNGFQFPWILMINRNIMITKIQFIITYYIDCNI